MTETMYLFLFAILETNSIVVGQSFQIKMERTCKTTKNVPLVFDREIQSHFITDEHQFGQISLIV